MFILRLIRAFFSLSGVIILLAIYVALAVNTSFELPLKDEITDITESIMDFIDEAKDTKSDIEDAVDDLR